MDILAGESEVAELKKIRRAAWANRFYPGQPDVLREMVETMLDAAPLEETGRSLLGLVVPHAGYAYSGPTAASGYRLAAANAIDTVIVLAPSHGSYIHGVAIFDGDAYETPLGEIPVDTGLSRLLAGHSPYLHLAEEGHTAASVRPEHALEVQLPFLQCALRGDFRLVAAVFHDYDWQICAALGSALAAVWRQGILIIASSDLYHGESLAGCSRADDETLRCLLAGDARAFCQGDAQGMIQACGAGPVAALLHAGETLGATSTRLLARTNSAEVTGERHGYVVGYAAVALEWP